MDLTVVNHLFRLEAPHFIAGLEMAEGKVIRAAPIIWYMEAKGWTASQVRAYAQRKGWKLTQIYP